MTPSGLRRASRTSRPDVTVHNIARTHASHGPGASAAHVQHLDRALHGLGPDTGPALSRAAKQLETLVTPEGAALPPNTLDEIRRDLARLAVVREQIEAIERDRLARLQQAPQSRSNAMFALLAGVVGVGIETADMLVQRSCRDRCETVEPRRATPA